MKYTKPPAEEWILESDYRRSVYDFLRSLPAEFEIVPEGHVCVKWPEGLPKAELERLATNIDIQVDAEHYWPGQAAALKALAAIAPEEKKKRKGKWIAWHKDTWLPGTPPILQHEDSSFPYSELGWRKVGECEVEE